MDFLPILSRWTHITSMAFIIGGALYARFILARAMEGMGATEKSQLGDRIAAALRPWMLAAIAALVGSGTYNLLNKPMIASGYHMWFGMKMLLAMHIIAVAVLLGRQGIDSGKRNRWTFGIAMSGLTAILLSAILRVL
ncbi:MAG: hypothetical protein SFV51_04585 [Bryobacteraceae bacterium]|nr:hypothetical protein [Bryobacteraceae bacterium]